MLKKFLVLLGAASLLSGCARVEFASHLVKNAMPAPVPASQGSYKVGNPYKIENRWYYPKEQYDLVESGIASWYGPGFHGKKTANGEIFDKYELTAAHRTLQMPSLVRVTNLDNGRSLIVRVNDRGPYKKGRIIDLSEKAADLLGFKNNGTAKVKLQVLRDESLKVAEIAKNGKSTKGYEIAANSRNGISDGSYEVASLTDTAPSYESQGAALDPVSREQLSVPTSQTPSSVAGQSRGSTFYPEPVVTEYPVTPSNIYIQAGSFSAQENAARLSDKLTSFHKAVVHTGTVNGSQFYRVRVGPLNDVAEADRLIDLLARNGYEDTIVVVD